MQIARMRTAIPLSAHNLRESNVEQKSKDLDMTFEIESLKEKCSEL